MDIIPRWHYMGLLTTVPRTGCAPPRHGPTSHHMGLHRVTVYGTQGGLRFSPAWSHVVPYGTTQGHCLQYPRRVTPHPGMVPLYETTQRHCLQYPRRVTPHPGMVPLYGTTQSHCLRYPGRVAPHRGMIPRQHYMGQYRVTVTIPRVRCVLPRHSPTSHHMGLHRVTVYGTQGCAPPRHGPTLHRMGLHRVTVYGTQGGLRSSPAWSHFMGLHRVTVYSTQGGLRPTLAQSHVAPYGTIQDPSHIPSFFSYLKMYNFNLIDKIIQLFIHVHITNALSS